MECLAEMKNRPNFIDAIEKFQLSGAYPVFFAILCTISGLGNKYVYLPIISVLALSILFSVLFVRDNKVFLTPIFMIYYSIGIDTPRAFASSSGNVIASFDSDGFTGICILAAIIVIPVFIRLVLDGSAAYAIKNRGLAFWGIVALNGSILIGGIFSEHWSPINLAYALILIAGLDVFYLIISSIIGRSNKDIIPYSCYVLVLTCLMISLQVILLVSQLHRDGMLLRLDPSTGKWILKRYNIALSWGLTTIIGASCACGIPAAMYLAKTNRFPILYYISALIMWTTTILVNARSSMLVGGVFLIAGIIIISLGGKNRKCNLMFTIGLVALIAVALTLAYRKVTESAPINEVLFDIYKFLRFDIVDDRIAIYKIGLEDFLNAPIFGVGWSKGALSSDLKFKNFYSNMYHCLPLQFCASAGIVGLAALGYHIKDIIKLALRRINVDRLMLLSVSIMILLMSLVDNFFFYLNFQIIYVAFLLLAEKHYELLKEQKTL